MPIGAHMSIAGGYYLAIEAGLKAGCDCVQIFTKSANQWRAKPITDEDVRLFAEAQERTGVRAAMAHDSYLINLAAPDDAAREKSRVALREEVERCERLGVPYLVTHPGSATDGDPAAGVRRIGEALGRVHAELPGYRTRVLLENTAGQGNTIGRTFGQLRAIMDATTEPERLGVCMDTCHAFVGGYDLRTSPGVEAILDEVAETIGLDRLLAIHANDARKPYDSRVDRHEHIGRGQIGEEAFRLLLNDPRLAKLPVILETEKGETPEGEDWDVVNIRTLRSLLEPSGKPAKKTPKS